MGFKNWIKKQAQRIESEDVNLSSKLMRRSFFHEYYEGYTEIMEPSNNRRGYKIKRIYSSSYYRPNVPDGKRTLIRVMYCSLLLLSAVLLCFAAWLPAGCNYNWYCTLPQAASFAFTALSILAGWNYVFCEKDLKIRDYKQGSRALIRWSLCSSITLALASFGAVVYCILHPNKLEWQLAVCIICYLLSAAAMLTVNRVESKVEYLVISNPVEIGNVPAFQIEEL